MANKTMIQFHLQIRFHCNVVAAYDTKNKTKGNEQKELLGIVIGNANRPKKLSEDIMDVTKIESNTIKLILLNSK